MRLQCSTATSTLRANTKTLTGFGYADRNESPSFIGIGRTNIYLSAYILLPDAGANKIEKISFPAAKADKDAYLLVLSEDGQTTLYNEPCEITAGVNEMPLKTPFVTEAGKRYLVGFATKVVAENERDTYVLPFDKKEDIDEALYIGIGTDPFPTSTNQKEFGIQYAKGNKLGSAFIFVTLQAVSYTHLARVALRALSPRALYSVTSRRPIRSATELWQSVRRRYWVLTNFQTSRRQLTRSLRHPLSSPPDAGALLVKSRRDYSHSTLTVVLMSLRRSA